MFRRVSPWDRATRPLVQSRPSATRSASSNRRIASGPSSPHRRPSALFRIVKTLSQFVNRLRRHAVVWPNGNLSSQPTNRLRDRDNRDVREDRYRPLTSCDDHRARPAGHAVDVVDVAPVHCFVESVECSPASAALRSSDMPNSPTHSSCGCSVYARRYSSAISRSRISRARRSSADRIASVLVANSPRATARRNGLKTIAKLPKTLKTTKRDILFFV